MDDTLMTNYTNQALVAAFEERPPSTAENPHQISESVRLFQDTGVDVSAICKETRKTGIMESLNQLENLFDNCQCLLREMREITVKVATNFTEVLETNHQQQEERCQQSLEIKLQQERERGTRKIQAVRSQCQELVLQMAKTVKEYFKKTMEDSHREHKQEIEDTRREGIEEGMRRQRDLLRQNMVCTNCQEARSNLFVCTGCWSACYCGVACQKSDWQTHMKSCHGFRQTYADKKPETAS